MSIANLASRRCGIPAAKTIAHTKRQISKSTELSGRKSSGKRRKTADSPRYKALGNSIALPFWDFLAKRISAQYLRPVTMGNLFDGISGFCLCFARWNGAISCRWASEIEEFPIAVAKKHFGDEETGEVGDIERILRSDKKENV